MINDMTGELTNIIAGNILSEMDEDSYDLSVPMTILGKNHIISWPRNREIIAFPMNLIPGDFEFQISMEINGQSFSLDP
jgi:chemotaxis protein CheX